MTSKVAEMFFTDRLNNRFNELAHNATARYNQRFDNVMYVMATKNYSPDSQARRANALINEALALCGHPNYTIHLGRKYSNHERAFLRLFL